MKDIDQSEFADAVLTVSRARPVVVDFWSSRCPPCHVLSPILEALEVEADGAWELVKIDVDANPQLADDYQVRGIPAVKAFVDGEVIDAFVGAWPREDVRRWLTDIVPSEADLLFAEARRAEEQGDIEEARTSYKKLLAQVERDDARIALARLAIAADDFADAASHLGEIPEARWSTLGGEAESVWLRLEVELLEEPVDDTDARFQAALRRVTADVDAALEQLLELVIESSDPAESRAGRAMVRVIATLGNQPRAATWRSRLGRALYAKR